MRYRSERVAWSGRCHACAGALRLWPPYATAGDFTVVKPNYVDHTVTDQTSIIRFVEDNWLNGQRIGNGSFDALANSIQGMMNFTKVQVKSNLHSQPNTGEMVGSTSAADSSVRSNSDSLDFSRRVFLCGAVGLAARGASPSPSLDPSRLSRFVDPLPIPPAAKSPGLRPFTGTPSERARYIRLAMNEFTSKVHRDLPATRIWVSKRIARAHD